MRQDDGNNDSDVLVQPDDNDSDVPVQQDNDNDSDVPVKRKAHFEKHASKYLNMLLALVLRLTHNYELSTEIAQQTMFKYFSRREKENWEPNIVNERAYLARMARNLVNDGWRASGTIELSIDDDQSAILNQLQYTFDLDKEIYLNELRETIPLKVILGGFTEYQLLLLSLREVHGLSYEAIGLEVNENKVLVRYELQKVMARIRARVKRIYGKKSFFKG